MGRPTEWSRFLQLERAFEDHKRRVIADIERRRQLGGYSTVALAKLSGENGGVIRQLLKGKWNSAVAWHLYAKVFKVAAGPRRKNDGRGASRQKSPFTGRNWGILRDHEERRVSATALGRKHGISRQRAQRIIEEMRRRRALGDRA